MTNPAILTAMMLKKTLKKGDQKSFYFCATLYFDLSIKLHFLITGQKANSINDTAFS